jgi:hypothetical protein
LKKVIQSPFIPLIPLRQRMRGESKGGNVSPPFGLIFLSIDRQREAPPSRAVLLTPNKALKLWRRTVGKDFNKFISNRLN